MLTNLRVSPFGHIGTPPTCPHCGKELGWWAVPNMEHHRVCLQNPVNKEALRKMVETFNGGMEARPSEQNGPNLLPPAKEKTVGKQVSSEASFGKDPVEEV